MTELDLFPLTLGNGVAITRLNELDGAIVCTMAEPWALVAPLVRPPTQLMNAGSVDLGHLRALAATLSTDARVVVGLGGGSSIDTAKFMAEVTGLPLVQIPTIISVDAAFTSAYGYRDDARVRYAGDLRPIEVIVDPSLIRQAPPELNRAGVGDLLSCHTAMFDWRLAVETGRGDMPWDEEGAALGRRVLDEVETAADEIAAVSDEGVRLLATIHQHVGAGCVAFGARFEEGSEHFLGYCVEWLTQAHRVHGELISFCALAMSFVQGNDPARAARIVLGTRVNARPSHLGIDAKLNRQMFAELPGYCERERLWPSVVETVEFTAELADAVLNFAREATEDVG
jgi:glycerol dehydrogenase-like iron-containing ADH family enzyme